MQHCAQRCAQWLNCTVCPPLQASSTSATFHVTIALCLPPATLHAMVWRNKNLLANQMYCDKTSSYEKLLLMAKLPSLYNRRLQDMIAILMYKVKNKLSPLYIQDLFCSHDKGHFLRNADFQIPRFKSITYGKHSIRYFGPFLWSKLNREDRGRAMRVTGMGMEGNLN